MHRTAGTGAFCSSSRYRFLNFTRVTARDRVAVFLRSFASCVLLSLSLCHSALIFHSHISVGGSPLLFYKARPVFALFYLLFLRFSLSFSLSPFLTLLFLHSLFSLMYYMRFPTFRLCMPIVRTQILNPICCESCRRKRRRGSDESAVQCQAPRAER